VSIPERVALVVTRGASGSRLDRFLAQSLAVSRSELQRWIAEDRVTIEGVVRGASARVHEGDRVVVQPRGSAPTDARAESDVRVDVLYCDEDLVVVNKPAGLVVHPSRGHAGGTLVNGLLALGLFAREDLQVVDSLGNARPGIVHRLDKGTSGVMVIARTAQARESLGKGFREHAIERAYEAIVVGEARSATFDTLHGRHPRDRLRFTTHVRVGKRAVTHVRVIARLCGATHVECMLETGRTHQIRMHLAESGTPVLGDPLYGKPPRDDRVRGAAQTLGHQALHARVLGFVHPRTSERVHFEAPPPEDFRDAIRTLTS
jgi:23S rRNA pseudouridine1911/1915/1917 synthase